MTKLKLKQTADRHCEIQLHERNIGFQHLIVTVAAYDNWEMQDNGRLRLSKRFGSQILDAVVSATTSGAYSVNRVVTAFPQGEAKMMG